MSLGSAWMPAVELWYKRPTSHPQGPALMSIDEVVGKVERLAANFANRKHVQAAIPQVRDFDARNSPGRFVFLNTKSKEPTLPPTVVAAMGLRSKGSNPGAEAPSVMTGAIEVFSPIDGMLLLDSKQVGGIQANEMRRLLRISAGPHRVEIRGADGDLSEDIAVLAGMTAYPAFKSPIDDTGKQRVGTLCVRAQAGDQYVDNNRVGHLDKDGTLIISNVVAGVHQCRSVSLTQGSTKTCYVYAGQSTDVDLRPQPPANLTVTVK